MLPDVAESERAEQRVHQRWLNCLPAEGRYWSPSLYLGLLPAILGLSALRFGRRSPPECRWLSWMVLAGALAALGSYGLGWMLDEIYHARGMEEGGWWWPVGGLYWAMTLVLPGFVDPARCLELRHRALQLAREHVPAAERATVFTADGKPTHATDAYFLTSGEAIRCFFEKDAFDAGGRLRQAPHLSLNKLGHAMHDLDPVFEAFSRTPELAAVAGDVGLREPLLLQSMYIFKQPHIGGEVLNPFAKRRRDYRVRCSASDTHPPPIAL